MQRVVSFYEKLPRGPAPEIQPKGLFARYQARYFGKNPSATREPSSKVSDSTRQFRANTCHSHHPYYWLSHAPRLWQ